MFGSINLKKETKRLLSHFGKTVATATETDFLAISIILFTEKYGEKKDILKNPIAKTDITLISMLVALRYFSKNQFEEYREIFMHDIFVGIQIEYKIDLECLSSLFENRVPIFEKYINDDDFGLFVSRAADLLVHDSFFPKYKEFNPNAQLISGMDLKIETEIFVRGYYEGLLPIIKKYTM